MTSKDPDEVIDPGDELPKGRRERDDVVPRSPVDVRLGHPSSPFHREYLLSIIIDKSTDALSFKNYAAFMDYVMCGEKPDRRVVGKDEYEKIVGPKAEEYRRNRSRAFSPLLDSDAYHLLQVATEAFVKVNCAVGYENFWEKFSPGDEDGLLRRVGAEDPGKSFDTLWREYLQEVNGTGSLLLPYLALIRNKFPELELISDGERKEAELCVGLIQEKLTHPCWVELIWSYWHEEGMLVQTLNAISRRFQNIQGSADPDPLAMVEIDPLRPLNNLLWGYIQGERDRLSLVRRAYEYDHHYGISISGKAVPTLQAADSRSKFLEAFHNLLYLCHVFFQQDDDTTVIADGFPVLNAIKEVHMLLAAGAHNQFGDLPMRARMEMMMQEWLLARPEFREFLPTRIMVDYPENWMGRVDAMKKLQGWDDTSVLHYRNLGLYGEKILLSIRYGDWSSIDDPAAAVLWARLYRGPLKNIMFSHQAVTGVDLTAEPTESQLTLRATRPSVLLQKRLSGRVSAPQLPSGQAVAAIAPPAPTRNALERRTRAQTGR